MFAELFIAIIFIALIWFGIRTLRLFLTGLASQNWPTAEGEVVRLDIEKISIENDYLYKPKITYHFQVQGVEYKGNRIGISERQKYFTESDAYESLHRFRLNKKVTVYYNPGRPSDCLLVPGITTASWLILILLFLLILGLSVLGLQR